MLASLPNTWAHTQRVATAHQMLGWLLPTRSITVPLGWRYLVEDSESFPDLLLTVCVFHLPGHHGQELGKVDGTVAFVDKQTEPLYLKSACFFPISRRFGFSPSASTSLIMSWSSASVGFCPRERITVPSSLVVMVPSPSLSNSENASLNSAKEALVHER